MQCYQHNLLIILLTLISGYSSFPKHNSEGQPCNNDNSTMCVIGTECPQAQAQVKQFFSHNFTQCGFSGLYELICCPTTATRNIDSTIRISEIICENYVKTVAKNRQIPLQDQVTGGKDASEGEFPHMVALAFYNKADKLYQFDCGGTLISNNFIITAAHCINNMDGNTLEFVRVGVLKVPEKTDVSNEKIDYKVKTIHKHPLYRRKGSRMHDLALAELEKPVTFNENIIPACLHTQNKYPEEFIITGWGSLALNGIRPVILQKALVYSVSLTECAEKYEKKHHRVVNNSQICAADTQNYTSDTCWGDSGGPLQVSNGHTFTLVGVTSYGDGCGSNIPTVYTRISEYLDWIESIVWP